MGFQRKLYLISALVLLLSICHYVICGHFPFEQSQQFQYLFPGYLNVRGQSSPYDDSNNQHGLSGPSGSSGLRRPSGAGGHHGLGVPRVPSVPRVPYTAGIPRVPKIPHTPSIRHHAIRDDLREQIRDEDEDERENYDHDYKDSGEDYRHTQYIDLAYTFNNDTIFYPEQQFDFNLLQDVGPIINETTDHYRYSYASWSFCMSEHGGTHLDAPFHYNKFGWRLAEIPIQRLVNVPLAVIDVEREVFSTSTPDTFSLKIEHLLAHEKKFGPIPYGSVVMVNFGWGKFFNPLAGFQTIRHTNNQITFQSHSIIHKTNTKTMYAIKFWPDRIRFMGWRNSTINLFGGRNWSLNYPGVSGSAARWLLKERKIVGLGVDTISPDIGSGQDDVVHIILLENQVYIIENVANLPYLIQKTRPHKYHQSNNFCTDLRLIVLPIKTLGTGGPVRLVAYCQH